MNLRKLGNNQTEVTMNGKCYFYSYETCVGMEIDGEIFIDECPVWGQESGISKTTRKHIKNWLEDRICHVIPHSRFMDKFKE